LHWFLFSPQKKKTHDRTLLFGRITFNHGPIFTTETSLWTCAWASATYTVMKLDCAAT
jgi:hypothetical protein